MQSEEMTPRERMEAFWEKKPIDRIPCIPLFGGHVVKAAGLTPRQFYMNSVNIAQSNIEVFRKYRYDSVDVCPYCAVVAEDMGAKVFYPENDTPWIEKPFFIEKFEDIKKLQKINPKKSNVLSRLLEALRIVIDKIGEEVSVDCCAQAPFTTAAYLRGAEQLAKDLYEAPDFVHELLEVCTENTLLWIDAVVNARGGTSLCDPTAGGSLLSPEHYKEFVLPYIQKVVQGIKNYGMKVSLHVCGRTHKIWELLVDTGADILSLDSDVNLLEAKRKIGDKVALMGNVDSVEVMLRGTSTQVISEAQRCIEQAYDNPSGYILSTGCDIPLNTPSENILALMKAAGIFGKKWKNN